MTQPHRHFFVVFFTLIMGFVCSSSQAIERYPLVYDFSGTALMGARDLSSAIRGVDRAVDFALSPLSDLPLAGAISLRTARFVLIDVPLSFITIWTQHEVFGHGARAREFGLHPTYHVAVPPPYGFNFAGNYTYALNLDSSQDYAFNKRVLYFTEGQEAEELLIRDLILQSFMSEKWRRINDLILMVRVLGDMSRLYKLEGDYNQYRALLHSLPGHEAFTPRWPTYVRWALDPLLWWSLYDYCYSYLIRGDALAPPPTFTLKGVKLLPRPSLRFAPWGEELGLMSFISFNKAMGEAEMLVGPLEEGAPTFFVTGYMTFLDLLPRLDLGGRFGLWFQPDITGGMIEAEVTCRLFNWGRLFGMGGWKSRGYVVGREYQSGWYTQFGMLLSF